ncbi:MAG: hypothetical protein ACKVT2_22185 [Saprospiraceae bacterium]
MKNLLLTAFVATTLLWISCNDGGKPRQAPDGKAFTGKWTYRSLFNQTNIDSSFNSLEFARAYVHLTSRGVDSLVGQILWAIDSPPTKYTNGLNLRGSCFYDGSTLCYFLEGLGDSTLGTAGWQYNYQGYLVPKWSDGVNQASVLVGSIVRVKKHSCDSTGNNCAPAGVVATTYMVKDQSTIPK